MGGGFIGRRDAGLCLAACLAACLSGPGLGCRGGGTQADVGTGGTDPVGESDRAVTRDEGDPGEENGPGEDPGTVDAIAEDPGAIEGIAEDPAPGDPGPVDEEATTDDGTGPDGLEARVESLLALLTLEEKIAQVHGSSDTQIEGFFQTPDVPRLGIPGFRIPDGGPRGVRVGALPATSFPVQMARGATFDTALEEAVGEAMGREARALGGHALLGPMLNLLRHPAWGRAQETYGEDTVLLAEMGAAHVRGAQRHVMACAKAFALNSVENLRFGLDVQVDERTLREVYLPHFRRVVEAGVGSVMTAYNSVNGDWCSQNRHLLADLLKGEWAFHGLVMSDWGLGVRSTLPALEAGLDLEMPRGRFFGEALRQAAARDSAVAARLDEAVRRVLRQKVRFGVLDPVEAPDPTVVASPAHRDLARRVAEESIVLLRNEGGLLPLDPADPLRVAVVGSLADAENLGDRGSSYVVPSRVLTPLAGLRSVAPAVEFVPVLTDTPDAAQLDLVAGADLAVVVTGLTWRDEGEYFFQDESGDRRDLTLGPERETLVKAVAARQPRTVVVLEGGSALIMEAWHDMVPAILMAWYPGQEGGEALARVLFGQVNPSGRLPLTIPRDAADLPEFPWDQRRIRYGFLHGYRLFDALDREVRYPFGFGLSYTRFRLGEGILEERPGEVRVRVPVTNVGSVAGTAVVQVYVGAVGSRVLRAPRELRRFARVDLSPGESLEVSFTLEGRDLAFYDTDTSAWRVEAVPHQIWVGFSSRDLPVSRVFTPTGALAAWREETRGSGVPSGGSFGPDVSCGGVECPVAPLGTPLCCTAPGTGMPGSPLENAGRAPGLCGTDIGIFVPEAAGACLQTGQPGVLDPACPDAEDATEPGRVIRGCCTDQGFCGQMETKARLGCLYPGGVKGAPCGPGSGQQPAGMPDPD